MFLIPHQRVEIPHQSPMDRPANVSKTWGRQQQAWVTRVDTAIFQMVEALSGVMRTDKIKVENSTDTMHAINANLESTVFSESIVSFQILTIEKITKLFEIFNHEV